ncbi:polysaccharide pyruvyl transferase family protein [Shewanella glacialimarina]|uniref:polysaccharide pyruvyl transferase family protein n=1 Tax=Shewanella glacialimarina TaxID=2590884 RepID=UPI001CF91F62|nr:polysaccharide pyruvyl transferase family protein [Shewanella glacialimarina]UCX03984.1 polysaccharide pyruvyl transferase family protein [Shewanella glacialimarina]
MIIEIKGTQFINKGAELMLYAALEQIKLKWPEAEIALRPSSHSPYLKRAKVGAWQKLCLHKHVIDINWLSYYFPQPLRSFLKGWGIVTEADIDCVLDASGFAYGDQWPIRQLTHTSKEITRFHHNKKPFILLPQALGPFELPILADSIKQHWQHAGLIFARDKVSYRHIEACVGESQKLSNLHLMPDFTNLVKGQAVGLENANRTVLFIPNNKMLSTKNNRRDWVEHYVDMMATYCVDVDKLGYIPVLLNHDGDKDQGLCLAIAKQANLPIRIVKIDDPLQVKGLIGEVAAVISSRFHGCVSALSQGVPCIGTSWSHKYEELFADYHQQAYLISQPNSDHKPQIDTLLTADYANACRTNPAIAELKSQSQQMWNLVFEKVESLRGN